MSISLKKRRANRRNALKSTGPKTPQGKAICRYNAVKHGLYSPGTIIISPRFSEDLVAYHVLQNSINESLNPVGEIQETIARQILNHFWLCHRFASARTSYSLSAQILFYWENRLFKKIRKLTDLLYYLQEIIAGENENADKSPSKIFRNEPNSWH